MEHHICKECRGVSREEKGVCNTEGCSMQGQPMEKCGCGDDNHRAPTQDPQQDAPKAE